MINQKSVTKKHVDVVLLIPGKQFSRNFVISFSNTIVYLLENKYNFLYSFAESSVVSDVRNSLFGQTFEKYKIMANHTNNTTLFGNTVTSDKIILLDSDMVWDIQALHKLMTSTYEVTVAPYLLGDRTNTSIVVDNKILSIEEMQKYTKPFKCSGGGLGFTCLSYKSIENLTYPWFSVIDKPDGSFMGEDMYFFNKIQEAGYDIYCDPTIKVGHEKSTILTI